VSPYSTLSLKLKLKMASLPFDNRVMWYPCSVSGFALGKIVDLGSSTFSVQPLSGGQVSQLTETSGRLVSEL